MALKKLLTDLSIHNSAPNRGTLNALSTAFQAYPNHYYPSNAGGFNYPNVNSIFNTTLFSQKNLRIGEGNAYDWRFQQFSEEPFIRNTIAELPISNWAGTILSNSANFISKFLLVVIITLFLLLGTPPKNTSDEWNDIIRLVKKYIFTKFLT